ncbi:MAG: D-alanyl-D-alanine carboxypeptidase family protein [Acutalibacteraceae bacterium]
MGKFFKGFTALLIAVLITLGTVKTNVCTVSALDENELTAASAVLMEATTGQIIYEKNAHDVRPCASITKLMTLILVFEAIDSGKIGLDDMVITSAHAASMGGSDIWLKEGEQMSVNDMIKATVVASANDAAVALAELVEGSEDAFVVSMNAKAQALGMSDTVFKNCNGLDEDGHVTSAYDVALMSREIMKHEKIFEYTSIWLDYLRDGATQIVNTNKLLKTYKGITGLKTGTTNKAGACITATAERDGLSLIAVVLGSKSGKERFTDAQKLLDYGFGNYTMHIPDIPTDEILTLEVTGGMQPQIRTEVTVGDNLLIKKGNEKNITSKVTYDEVIEAPIEIGQQVGTLEYFLNDTPLAQYPIVSVDQVEEIHFGAVLKLVLNSFFKI